MQLEIVLRWTARAWSIASVLVIFAFVFGEQKRNWPTVSETVGLLLFPVTVIVGFGIACWREAWGGLITVAGLSLFYMWMFHRDGRLPTGPYFLLLTAPGFLFLASAVLRRRRTH